MAYSLTEAKDIIKATPPSVIIGQYIPLQKKGANEMGLCPFHSDSNPSLSVSDQKGIFKCFVCGAVGDAIKFVEQFKRLDFPHAIKEIAHNLGLNITEDSEKQKVDPKLKLALKILDVAERIYFKYAREKETIPLDEFIKSRHLKVETSDQFQLGFAPAHNLLTNYLESFKDETDRQQAMAAAEEIGIIKKGQYGYYDTFKNRIIFPIWDEYNKVRGFGSRSMEANPKQAKYINSQESLVFKKGQILYGMNFAKASARELNKIILTEGYMDTIAMVQAGFSNTIAIMGIAISENAVANIKRITHNIFFALDNDKAGKDAAKKNLSLFLSVDLMPKWVDLTPCKDPDEFLSRFGYLEMNQRIEESKPLLDILIDEITAVDLGESTDLKLATLEKVFALLKPLGNSIKASERAVQAAKNLQMNSAPEVIAQAYASFLKNEKRPIKQNIQPLNVKQEPLEEPSQQLDGHEAHLPLEAMKLNRTEQNLVTKFLQFPELLELKDFTEVLDFVNNSRLKDFLEKMATVYPEVDEEEYREILTGFVSPLDDKDDLKKLVLKFFFGEASKNKNEPVEKQKLIEEMKKKMQIEFYKTKKDLLKAEHKSAKTKTEIDDILEKIYHIDKKLFELKGFTKN
jgi:DNA primase